MNLTRPIRHKIDAHQIGLPYIVQPSAAFGEAARFISAKLAELGQLSPTLQNLRWFESSADKSISEQLYDALASFKIRTAQVAMYLERNWRNKLFDQLDDLLDAENWEPDDSPPLLASFSTLLRLLISQHVSRRPGLGATHDGKFVAAWTSGSDRLTIECLADDMVRWNLSVNIEGETERAAGVTPLLRLEQVLSPYHPARWFDGTKHESAE